MMEIALEQSDQIREFARSLIGIPRRIEQLEKMAEQVSKTGGVLALSVEALQDGVCYEVGPEVLLPRIQDEMKGLQERHALNQQKARQVLEIINY